MIVSSYKPNVRCSKGSSPPWQSTVNIIANMVATKNRMNFGRQGGTNVDINLPFLIRACRWKRSSLLVSRGLTWGVMKMMIERHSRSIATGVAANPHGTRFGNLSTRWRICVLLRRRKMEGGRQRSVSKMDFRERETVLTLCRQFG